MRQWTNRSRIEHHGLEKEVSAAIKHLEVPSIPYNVITHAFSAVTFGEEATQGLQDLNDCNSRLVLDFKSWPTVDLKAEHIDRGVSGLFLGSHRVGEKELGLVVINIEPDLVDRVATSIVHAVECWMKADLIRIDGTTGRYDSFGAEESVVESSDFSEHLESLAHAHASLEVKVIKMRYDLEPKFSRELHCAGHGDGRGALIALMW